MSDADDLPVRLSDLTPEDRDFLQAIGDADGAATTREIKSASGLQKNQIHTRYEKFGLDGSGLVVVDRVGSDHGGFQQNTARLTEAGERTIDSGLLDEITDPNANILDLRERLDALNNRLTKADRRYSSLRRELDATDREVLALEDRVEEVEIFVGDLRREDDVLGERVDELERENRDLRERVEKLAEKVEE